MGDSDGENFENEDPDPESRKEFDDFKRWLDEKMPNGSEAAPSKLIEKSKACLKCGATSCDCTSVCMITFLLDPHRYRELIHSKVQYLNMYYIHYSLCGFMGTTCPVPVPSCQCQGTQVASKLKAAREQIAQRLEELRKKSEQKLLGFVGGFLVGSWHLVIDEFKVANMQLSFMVFTLGPHISSGFIPLPIHFCLVICLSEEWLSGEAPML